MPVFKAERCFNIFVVVSVSIRMTGRINTGAPPHTGSADYVQWIRIKQTCMSVIV